MSAQTIRLASRLPWTPCLPFLALCVLALSAFAAQAQVVLSDASASLAKDESPGDSLPWDLGVDNDADTMIDEDPTLDGVDDDGDGADGEDPAVDVVKAGEPQLVPVQFTFAAGDVADTLVLTASIAGPAACDPRWISEGEAVSVTRLWSLQFSQLTWANVPLAAGEAFSAVRKYSVSCPAGTYAFNIYAHATSATGLPDPASLNNQAENQLLLVASGDVDADGIANEFDGCDWTPDAGADTDADGLGDPCDVDDDGDGFTDATETFLGTDPSKACNDDSGADAWPPDVTGDQRVNIFDVMAYRGHMLGLLPYDVRFDLDRSAAIDLGDLQVVGGFIGESC